MSAANSTLSIVVPRVLATLAVLTVTACASRAPGEPAAPTGPEIGESPTQGPPPAPWSTARLGWEDAPAVYREAWSAAENRARCAPIALVRSAVHPNASPRRAQFSGGWAVAYDLPGQRSAYGVAGTGVDVDGPAYDGFPSTIRWADGSFADYGLEGGTGPNYLAYLTIDGQGCLYNIWSALGEEHLEGLLTNLRFISTAAG
jgi:hypothetical protein